MREEQFNRFKDLLISMLTVTFRINDVGDGNPELLSKTLIDIAERLLYLEFKNSERIETENYQTKI